MMKHDAELVEKLLGPRIPAATLDAANRFVQLSENQPGLFAWIDDGKYGTKDCDESEGTIS